MIRVPKFYDPIETFENEISHPQKKSGRENLARFWLATLLGAV